MTLLTVAPTAEPTEKATRITREARDALFLYFANTRWPLNKRLPRGKLWKDLAIIVQEHRLDKLRIVRQLKNYKDKKYILKDVVLEMTPKRIKEVLEESICMEYPEFVCGVLSKVWDIQSDLGNRDLNNHAAVVGEFPPVALDLMRASSIADSPCLVILSKEIKHTQQLQQRSFQSMLLVYSMRTSSFVSMSANRRSRSSRDESLSTMSSSAPRLNCFPRKSTGTLV